MSDGLFNSVEKSSVQFWSSMPVRSLVRSQLEESLIAASSFGHDGRDNYACPFTVVRSLLEESLIAASSFVLTSSYVGQDFFLYFPPYKPLVSN